MQASQKHNMLHGSDKFYDDPRQNPCPNSWPPNENLGDSSFSDDNSQTNQKMSLQTFGQYCTLESSTTTSGYAVRSSSTESFSPNGSPLSQPGPSHASKLHHSPDNRLGSPDNISCLTNDVGELRHKIRELETVMLGPESDIIDIYNDVNPGLSDYMPSAAEKWNQLMETISRGDLKEMLCVCAKALADNDMETVEWLLSELRQMVSVFGEPIQRLGAYMLEGLVARLASSGSSIYKSLRCKEPAGAELLSYMHLLYEICPYFKFGYMSANGAIAEAMKDESRIHIIDFQIAQGSQWFSLIPALASRPGGPPRIRITGVDDSTSAYARGRGLEAVGLRLSKLAEKYKVPFEFHAAGLNGSVVKLEELGIESGEAIAVNFALMLHHMPDESVSIHNHRDRLIRLAKYLSPKVVTLVEQESNTNTAPFLPRFIETLDYYTAVFESIDATNFPRDHKERINVEQHCLAREIVNLIACEGANRVERHELLSKWRSRFSMAGFTPYPLSSFVNATIRDLLKNYSDKYTLEERTGALYLGWMSRPLVASCAWR